MVKILNAKGEKIDAQSFLNDRELAVTERMTNALSDQMGYVVDITTLTAILRSVSEQKFYQIPFADYVPVKMGTEAAWAEDVLAFREHLINNQFEKGYIDTAVEGRLATADATVDSIRVKARVWAKELSWSLPEIGYASRTGVWDVVTAKEKARRKGWDLGLQETVFLGTKDGILKGALNLPDVTIDSGTLVVAPLSTMTTAQFNTFVAKALQAYQSNAGYTAYPDFLWVPQDDYNGLAAPSSGDYPIKSRLQLLEETFQTITRNPNFKILPLAYSVVANSNGVLTKNRYVFGRYDEDTFRMDVPVDYTVTVANTVEGFTFRNVGYGQHTGVLALRPQELLYMDAA